MLSILAQIAYKLAPFWQQRGRNTALELIKQQPSRVHVQGALSSFRIIIYTALTGLWQVNKTREVQASTTPECFVLQFYWLPKYYDSSQEWQPAKMSWRNRRLWDSEIYSYLECFGQLDDESALSILSQFFQTDSKKLIRTRQIFGARVLDRLGFCLCMWDWGNRGCLSDQSIILVALRRAPPAPWLYERFRGSGTAFRSWGIW